jgi:hypothetical protein
VDCGLWSGLEHTGYICRLTQLSTSRILFMMARQATLPPPHRAVVTPILISNKGIWI